MLTKLLKKDFQSTARYFLPLIIGFAVLSVLCKILLEIGMTSAFKSDEAFLTVVFIIFLSLYVIYIIGYCVMTYVFIVIDFYKTMVSEQAYLTHTLPVKTSSLIVSKLSIAVLWQLVTYGLICLSIGLFFVGHFHELNMGLSLIEFEQEIGLSLEAYLGYIAFMMIIGSISGPLMFYACIAIGHLFGKHRIIGAIVSYLGIYTVLEIFCAVVMVAMGYKLFITNSFSRIFSSYMWFGVIFTVVTSVIFYFLTEFIFRKKLNLD